MVAARDCEALRDATTLPDGVTVAVLVVVHVGLGLRLAVREDVAWVVDVSVALWVDECEAGDGVDDGAQPGRYGADVTDTTAAL
jgi:hypothetical protein